MMETNFIFQPGGSHSRECARGDRSWLARQATEPRHSNLSSINENYIEEILIHLVPSIQELQEG